MRANACQGMGEPGIPALAEAGHELVLGEAEPAGSGSPVMLGGTRCVRDRPLR
jgi:hypothetical protein